MLASLTMDKEQILHGLRTVLVLQSKDEYSCEDIIVRKTLHEVFRLHTNCELLHERIEGIRDDARDSSLTVKIFGEHAKRNVDLILSVGSEPTRFLLEHKHELWPATPAVFSMVTADDLPEELPAQMTGVKSSSLFASCAELALLVDPDTSHIFCIGTQGSAGDSAGEKPKRNPNVCPEIFDFAYLNSLPLFELRDRLAQLPNHSSVLLTNGLHDVTGHSYEPRQLCEAIASSSSVPVYAMSDTFLGCGVVGASTINIEADVRRAADLGLAILRGARIEDLPVDKGIPNQLIVDSRQARKRGIAESRLPDNVIRKYRENEAAKWLDAFIFAGAVYLLGRAGLNRLRVSNTRGREHSDSLVRRLARRFIEETENERMRVARELHDDIGQRLSLIAMKLGALDRDTANGTGERGDEIKESLRELDALISDVHNLSHSLHTSMLEHLGIDAALKELCLKISGLHGVQVDFESNGTPDDLSHSAALCFYRVAQEALANVVKHSGALLAHVTLFGNGKTLRMEIRDFGLGFNLDTAPIGLGFTTMKERLSEMGGRLTARSERGMGTLITAEIPLSQRTTIRRAGIQTKNV